MNAEGIGKAVQRKEDRRFLTGTGTYTDDLRVEGQCYASFVRSPHAHAHISAINLDAARAATGVVAAFSHADMAADGIGNLVAGWMIHSHDGTEMKQPPHPALAEKTVRYVGDPVAVVIGESLAQVRDAAELVDITYETLDPSVDTAKTVEPGAPQLHEGAARNICFEWELGDRQATDAAFANAAHVSTLEFTNNRLIPNAVEPRAALAKYNAGTGHLTLYLSSQAPHIARLLMSAFIGIAPEHKLRVISPDVGGGFGSKMMLYNEEVVCAWAAKKLVRPVKWTAERSESFLTDAHGRDHVTKVELALDADAKFLGLRVKTLANLGAYLSTFGPLIPTWLHGTLLAGQYKTPAIDVSVTGVFTNTAPVDAYRGAGRPEASYVIERIVETAARELGLDPAELRRRNFIAPDNFPYETPVALTYDIGDYQASLDKMLEASDLSGYAARKAASEKAGKLRGRGLSCYIEACGMAPSQIAGALGAGIGLYEVAEVRVHPTGNVTIFTGSQAHGQGHETTFAQIVSDKLGIPFDNIEVVHGDTGEVPFGLGTYGSRSAAVGGSAVVKALDKIVAKGKKISAHILEASEADIEFSDGAFRVAGTDRSMTFEEVAGAAYSPFNYPLDELEPGLDETSFYDPANFTYPAGSYLCEVEIDKETGTVSVEKFTAVDDFGNLINPMIVEGQVHGGIAQGIGQALLEHAIYEPQSGQLQTGSYMDYCMPRADDMPALALSFTRTPCTHNPLGVKGCGEAGAIGTPAAVINAITDALGVRDIEMPATPERIWRVLHNRPA